jgi:hypothetical protein
MFELTFGGVRLEDNGNIGMRIFAERHMPGRRDRIF